MRLDDHFTDLRNARTLLVTSGTNLSHEGDLTANVCDHVGHGSANPIHRLHALFSTRKAGEDESVIALGCSRINRAPPPCNLGQ